MNIAYNPNIIEPFEGRLTHEDFLTAYRRLYWEVDNYVVPKEVADASLKFIELYDKATNICLENDRKDVLLNTFGCVPLAPRLDLKLGDEQPFEQDHLTKSRFGGIPDLTGALCTHWEFIDTKSLEGDSPSAQYLRQQIAMNPPDPDQRLKDFWPICNCCHERMKFVGQFDLGHWAAILAFYTKRPWTHQYGGEYTKNIFKLNVERGVESLRTPKRFTLFMCDEHHFNDPNCDARVMITGHSDKRSYEDYLRILRYNIPAECYETPVRLIENIKLGFDLDAITKHECCLESPHLMDYPDWWGNSKMEKGLFAPSFKDTAYLFGAPRSQQTARRYLDAQGLIWPKRMHPFLNWSDWNEDQSCSMYAGLHSGSECRSMFYGKMDKACT